MSDQQAVGASRPRPSYLSLFLRLTRAQFLPLIVLPAIVGTAYAYRLTNRFNPVFFGLVLFGVVCLHLGANAIDDAYDFQNGVDRIANSMFPKDFGGWKPIPRGYMTLATGKIISFTLLGLGLITGLYFWRFVGWFGFALAASGALLAIFYCAPPLKLDYRGLALGEIAIFFTFGPLPVMGAYFVQTGSISLFSFLVSIPVGLMTVTILMDHDLIFYEVYSKSRKMSLTTVLGRRRALQISAAVSSLCYLMIGALVLVGILPSLAIVAPTISTLILARKWRAFRQSNAPPPFYVAFTVNALFSDWIFSLCLAAALLL